MWENKNSKCYQWLYTVETRAATDKGNALNINIPRTDTLILFLHVYPNSRNIFFAALYCSTNVVRVLTWIVIEL